MAKKGQSKYMPHLRATRSVAKGVQVLGKVGRSSDVMAEHERMQEKAKTNTNKGKRGGDCNRTQCQRPHAWWYNNTMRSYYCGDCAGAINESCLHKDHIASFASMVYVMPPVIRVDEFEEGCQVVITTGDSRESVYSFHNTKEEADDAFGDACRDADLRPDGTPPFHYSELRDKMLRNRELIQQRYPTLEMVPFE